jgi:hypothetical protein
LPEIYRLSPKKVKSENIGEWLPVSRQHWPVFFLHPFPDAKLFILTRLFCNATGSGRRIRAVIFVVIEATAVFIRLPAFWRKSNSIVIVL